MFTEAQVLDALRQVMDPDINRDIVSLGFVKALTIEGGDISFDLELTTPACPMKRHFLEHCEAALKALPGCGKVNIRLTARQAQKHGAGAEVNGLADVAAIIAVSSCKGGVGKSTVAAHLARALQEGGVATGLLDADVFGPSLPTLFNLQGAQVMARDNMIVPLDVDGLKVMSLGFLLGDAPAVLRGPMASGYVQQVLMQTDWGKLDCLVIDMPPGTGDIQLTIVQIASLDGAVIVTTPQALSLVDVARGIMMFEKVHVPVLGIVENMASFSCDGCGKTHHPFGRGAGMLQKRFGIETLAELPIIPGVSDMTRPRTDAVRAAFAGLADKVRRGIGKRRLDSAKPEVELLGHAVHVIWPDGHERTIGFHDLRNACPCANCIDEYSGEKLIDPAAIPTTIAPDGFEPLGNYAVVFHWNDGHSTGIYGWDYLRELGQ